MESPPSGKKLGSDDSGLPAWVDIPPPGKEESIVGEKYDKSIKINSANAFINNKQWPSKLALGRISENDKDMFINWLDYLDALERVDTTDPESIVWPESPNLTN